MRTLMWFREDLRITDNTALYHASSQATEGCLAVYCLTPKTWHEHSMAACRVDFILRGLAVLGHELSKLGIHLLILECHDFDQTPDTLLKICQQYDIEKIHFNRQYEVNEKVRDEAVTALLSKEGIAVHTHHDQTILAPGQVLTQQNQTYTVFTPYKKAWIDYYCAHPVSLLPRAKKQKKSIIKDVALTVPSEIAGFKNSVDSKRWPAGEAHALKRLHDFSQHGLLKYQENRDFPARDGTSQLSPYLATGMISARQCLQLALECNRGQLDHGNPNIVCWINEIIWREFYKEILIAFPRVCKNKPFKVSTERLIWDQNADLFRAWATGQTGFPIIDAAMRQLQQTGWMHNRLRMLTAMFFSKLLWLDWRQGEKFFMQHLIDGDFSANNGGWQWCASTGTDAVPYFRIFNPYAQSQKFDPEGVFIRTYCPELHRLDNKSIHHPTEKQCEVLVYPKPIIDYKKNRERALEEFKK